MNLIYLSLIIINSYLVNTQNSISLTSINLAQPISCLPNQYFDISHLSCQNCPVNSAPIDRFNCRCNQNSYFKYNDGGGSVSCVLCPSGFIQSLDGYTCVKCDQTCQACISSGGYRTDLDQNGKYFTSGNDLISNCFVCDQSSSRLNGDRCVSCKPLLFAENVNITAASCSAQTITSAGGLLILDGSSNSDPSYFNVVFGNDNSITSWYYATYLLAVYRTCRSTTNRRNVTACQTLGNLCVLNLYNTLRSGSIDACVAFNQVSGNSVRGNDLPWLFYSETYGIYKASYISYINSNQKIALTFSPTKCEPNNLAFYVAAYALNGSLISFDNFDVSKIQLCNIFGLSIARVSPFSASYFTQSCSIPLSSLLDYGSQPVFYDFYIKYSNGSSLFPIPIKTLNYLDSAGNPVNTFSDETNQRLQRRLFLVDSISGKPSKDSVPKYIRYAKSISFQFTLVDGQTQGVIYPPVIVVNYDFVNTNDLNLKVKTTFEINYFMTLDSQVQAIWISVGVLSFIAFVWSIFRTWIWSRRSGKLAIDIITLFKFIMYFSSGLSNVFFIVTLGVSLYWLIFYKGQGLAFVFLPQPFQEDSFKSLLIIAFILKFIDIVYLILVQCSYDVFFIDWERPKLKAIGRETYIAPVKSSNTTEKPKEDSKLVIDDSQNYNAVSCWRSLFVANEWNEIQVFRKINPTIQFILLLFFLKVVNLESFTRSDCNSSLFPDASQYQAPYNGILRVAMASSMYIAIGLLQYIFYNFIYIRCVEDITGRFIDFCSVANISIFIMTHSQYGFYIHGRSPHGNADTSMQQMAQALQKEENNLLTKRGLEEGSDHQTFSVSLSNKLSKQYSKVMNPVYEQKGQKPTGANNNIFEKKMLAYTQLNRFLIAFIDNILREMKYIIVRRNFLENVLDFEFKEPILAGYFYKDNDKSFENALFCGKERKLFIFDLLVFIIVDYFAFNYVLAALIAYIVMIIYKTSRHDLGKQNISRKTLVDKRFLI